MTNANNGDKCLNDVIDCRFLNQDGVGVVLGRLSQPEVVRLFHWFLDDGGGRSGALLLENAPLFDTGIEVQAALPAVDRREIKEKDGAESGVGHQGDFGPSEECQADVEGEYSIDRTRCDANTPQMLAYGFFGAGLLWGASYLEFASSMSSSPFPARDDMSDFLSHIFSSEGVVASDDVSLAVGESARSPALLTLRLIELLPAFDFVIRSAYRLSTRCAVDSGGSMGCGSHYRYLFFLGLLASGLPIPELAWQSCYSRKAL